ncbi:MAG: NAD(P)H-hydrate dehydratase [Candidatus Omnitrophica bacterium]|nr:NAD(P)H-hydrate dehydratase [Candidatus Omnitrophota bacterium]MBU1925458.1 NAD(P)H-hydrate dehydratase [Candidatus Omnitrophota bacterium]
MKKFFKADALKRKKNAHKGDFGHVFVLAGSAGYTGAACLCSRAALVSGAGLVTLGIGKSLNAIVARKLTEAMTRPLPDTKDGNLTLRAFKQIKAASGKMDVLAIGPGLSRNPNTQKLIRKVIAQIRKPMVIDADGLNALTGHLDVLRKNSSAKIITPHPGEMGRLLKISASCVQKKRKQLAKQFSDMYNVVTVLKGARTVVASNGREVYINKTGNPGMAKGGSGDVLCGIIAALLAQGLAAFDAAKLGVYVHGLAGDLALDKSSIVSLLASDIIAALPQAFKKIYRNL